MCVEKIQEPVTRERQTVDAIKRAKNTVPLVCLTAYTAPMAKILDQHCDLLLVGDSLGMAVYGMENTLGVSLDMMIAHGRAVVKHSAKACVIVDMPFGTYENNLETALHNARKIMRETGCSGVKLEGGADLAPTIAYLARHNIPVMGHIGLLPQSVVKEGGYKIKGKTEEATAELIKDGQAIAAAGAFAIVIEGTIESAAQEITRAIDIPTIGIGASSACDGQILVSDDMLGLLQGHTPKFVKKYENLASIVEKAVDSYACDVRNRKFPTAEFTYGLKK